MPLVLKAPCRNGCKTNTRHRYINSLQSLHHIIIIELRRIDNVFVADAFDRYRRFQFFCVLRLAGYDYILSQQTPDLAQQL